MVARDVRHLHALAAHAQDLLHHVVVRLGPVPAALQPPAVDDVADQVELFALEAADEVEQELGLAAARAQMDVGDEDGAIAADRTLVHAGPRTRPRPPLQAHPPPRVIA